MFDRSGAEFIDGMSAAWRAESAAIAARLDQIGRLDAQRTVELAQTVFWRVDPFEEVAAEVSAALRISHARAGTQIRHARALRKMPAVAARFAAGDIDWRVMEMILHRTPNVTDEAWPGLDAAMARHCDKWMRLSEPKLRDRIDQWIAKHDPDAVRVPPEVADGRYVEIAPTEPGMAGIWARLDALDAAAFEQRLITIAATVCDQDPRTGMQRRTDAIGALGRGRPWLDCQCGLPDCPAVADKRRAADVVIHVLANQSTLDGTSNDPGYLPGFGVQPAETVRAAAQTATIKPVVIPQDTAEPRYRPSATLATFIRWRDLTCRFPGCDQPAVNAEIDHTTPYPVGPTHPSNTKLYCTLHHLVKTFCAGWWDRQSPDGTVEFTTPTGHVYSTDAHGAVLFPVLGRPTETLDVPGPQEPGPHKAVMMPRRRQTRDQDTAQRIAAERRLRHALNEQLAETQRQQQQWLTDHAEPPPF
ncbi:hypothetical protein EB73_37460 [Mycobacterium sp. SWH-M3]|nr:hypothetical protein EB73_37460 [Mycobacterium sp. SWH-M3]